MTVKVLWVSLWFLKPKAFDLARKRHGKALDSALAQGAVSHQVCVLSPMGGVVLQKAVSNGALPQSARPIVQDLHLHIVDTACRRHGQVVHLVAHALQSVIPICIGLDHRGQCPTVGVVPLRAVHPCLPVNL